LAEISPEFAKLSRRRLLRNGLSLGSLALLTGCDLSTDSGVDAALWAMLRFDDRVQAWKGCRGRFTVTTGSPSSFSGLPLLWSQPRFVRTGAAAR
jgi:hypothetical protein